MTVYFPTNLMLIVLSTVEPIVRGRFAMLTSIGLTKYDWVNILRTFLGSVRFLFGLMM